MVSEDEGKKVTKHTARSVRRHAIGLLQVLRPWRSGLQCCCIFLKPLVIMPTDLPQDGKICRCHREFRQRLNRHCAGELCDMDFVGTKCEGWLSRECSTGQEIDRARPPGLTGKSRLADGEDIIWTVQCTRYVGQANTGIGD